MIDDSRRPSIVEVIGERVELRRAGREWKALCPFHAEKTPSFSVNEDRGVFYCHGCHAGGDVMTFTMMIDRLTFRQACAALGIAGGAYRPRPVDTRKRRAAAMLADWLNEHHLKVGAMLRELSGNICLAEEIPDAELVESLTRAWEILSDLHGDLQHAEYAGELWGIRDTIELLTADVEPDALPILRPVTESYREFLRSLIC